MEYKLALQNAQRNAEQQRLVLEKAKRAIENPDQPSHTTAAVAASSSGGFSSSGKVDPARVKQFLERRKQEQEAKKTASLQRQPLPPPVPSQAHSKPHQHQNGSKPAAALANDKDSEKRAKKNGEWPVKEPRDNHASRKRLSGDASSVVASATEAKKSKSAEALPQPAPASADASTVTRQYLMMRRQELLKELEKIDRKLQQLDQHAGKPTASQPVPKQKQQKPPPPQHSNSSKGKDQKGDHVKKIPHQPPPPQRRHHETFADDNGDEEEEDDADSFIDDSEDTGHDYSSIVREVHKTLKFDPRRYASVNPFDDCRGMVASYGDIEREERNTRRAGLQEDATLLRQDTERRERRLEKRKHKGMV